MSNNENKKIERMDVEQLNIVEKDGTIKMSLFNSNHMPAMIFEGEDILPGHRQDDNNSGIMFYDGPYNREKRGSQQNSLLRENHQYNY